MIPLRVSSRIRETFLKLEVRLAILGVLLVSAGIGCGTTRITDTQRTATEQLLVSNAVDSAVSQLDFRPLAGKSVFFDPQYLDGSVDRGYVVSSLRQHLLASGCILQEDRTKANYVVEARTGGIGTDRHAVLVGVPQMTVPALVPGQPSVIPEIPIAKKTDQKGLVKIGVFAYNRVTGRPVWQSGVVQAVSTAKDTWLLGVGPLQRGTVRDGTEFAGSPFEVPLLGTGGTQDAHAPVVPVTQAASWSEQNSTKSVAQSGETDMARWLRLSGLATFVPKSTPSTTAAKPANPSPAPPPTPNAGGQAENEPARVLSSGFGFKPDG